MAEPPIPPVTFRVGVSGHRPNRLQRADPTLLNLQITRVLDAIRDAVAQTSPAATLRVLSSLAEGADRLVAHAALDLGFVLQAPLPFPREDYESDFNTPASKQEFHALLARADTIFELDRPGPERARGYRAAGEIVLDQSDLLLVIWDGEPAAGIGGTPELIERAQARGRPVLRIDAAAPHPITFGIAADPLAALAALIRSQLTLPAAAQPIAEAYRKERWPTRSAATSYTFVRLFGDGRFKLPARPRLDDPVPEITLPALKPFFHWADALANHYGERSRSAALRLQLLALASVVSGLLSIPFEEHIAIVRLLSTVELGTTLLLVAAGLSVARRPWHPRWLLFRSLAEQLRTLDFLAPLALATAHPALSAQEDAGALFAAHHLDAITRHLGVPSAQVSPAFLAERRTHLAATLESQASFQATASERYETIEQTLHRLGLLLFAAAVVLSFYDVAKSFDLTHFASPWTTTMAALLPALGAAFASIAAQGEYQRLASRARGMRRTLTDLLATLQSVEPLSLASLGATARLAAEVLTSEVRDWHILVAARKPSLPV